MKPASWTLVMAEPENADAICTSNSAGGGGGRPACRPFDCFMVPGGRKGAASRTANYPTINFKRLYVRVFSPAFSEFCGHILQGPSKIEFLPPGSCREERALIIMSLFVY